jgi:hypothetical protein
MGKIVIPGPKIKYDIKAHFSRLKTYLIELEDIRDQFNSRIDEIRNSIVKKETRVSGGQYYPPAFSFIDLSSKTDPVLNRHFKSYFFIYRQAIDSTLELIYLMKDALQTSKAKFQILKPSRSGNFSKFIINLKEGKYSNYDKQLIDYLDENAELLIIPRIIRNQIKEIGTIPVHIINDTDFYFHIPIPKKVRGSDKSYKLITLIDKSILDKSERLRIKSEYLSVCTKFMKNFVNNLEYKYVQLYKTRKPKYHN